MKNPLSIEAIKKRYHEVVVQIATPYSNGTGFYLPQHNLIVTSEYVVRDNRSVIVEGAGIERQLAPVVLTDYQTDLAFLQPRQQENGTPVILADHNSLKSGDWVVAIGHPFGLPYVAKEGHIVQLDYAYEGQKFMQIDAHLKPGYVGGPVVNLSGEVVGINTFLVRKEDQIDFALPVDCLHQLLEAFVEAGRQEGQRCVHCQKMVFAPLKKTGYCNHCGKKITLPSALPVYEPEGIALTIEALITEVGHQAALTRRGPNNWEIRQGSAKVSISYYEKNGLIIGDAYLCELPSQNEKPLLEYLLKQNHSLGGLTFSLQGSTVVLSLLIYDRYFNAATGPALFRNLFETADYQDNILVEKFGAIWRKEEET